MPASKTMTRTRNRRAYSLEQTLERAGVLEDVAWVVLLERAAKRMLRQPLAFGVGEQTRRDWRLALEIDFEKRRSPQDLNELRIQ